MFPNNVVNGLLRHSEAHLRRETIAFGRRANAVTERKPDRTTPAMRLGLTREPWSWARMFARRLFPGRLALPASWLDIYRRAWTTPGGLNAPHDLSLAY